MSIINGFSRGPRSEYFEVAGGGHLDSLPGIEKSIEQMLEEGIRRVKS